MAAGTPVVAGDNAGYARVARQGSEAVLVPPGDAPALAVALGKVLSDPGLCGDLVANGLARAEEFSMQRLAGRYLEAYRSIAA
jgi:glycosyltransferase involved in cell wall biosynthesis